MRKAFLMVAIIVAVVGFDAYVAMQYLAARPTEEPNVTVAAFDDHESFFEIDNGMVSIDAELASGGENFRPLRFAYDIPGVSEPEMLSTQEAKVSDDAYVIGIEVNGEAFAFSVQTMDIETHHIVNFVHKQTPITVTYCPMSDCVRVLTRDESELIPLRLGGLNDHEMMVVMLDGQRYDQDSKGLPLSDYAHTRTTFGEWKRDHPNTKVFTEKSISSAKKI